MRQLRKEFSGEELHLVCRKGLGSFFKQLGLVDIVFEVEKGKGSSPYRVLLRELSDFKYQRLWCPHESVRSALVTRQIKAKKRIGYYHWWNSGFFNQRSKRPMHLPEALRLMSLLAGLRGDFDQFLDKAKNLSNPQVLESWNSNSSQGLPDWASMDLMKAGVLSLDCREKLFDEARIQRENLGWQNKRIVILAPGSNWPTKRWSLESYMKVARSLVDQGFGVVLMGNQAEREICQYISESVPETKNWAGLTELWSSFCLMTQAEIFVGNDSGATHLAVCASLPVIALFGPTTLSLGYRPWSDRTLVVQRKLNCRPCGKHGALVCPIQTHDCMNKIEPEEVIVAINDFLSPS